MSIRRSPTTRREYLLDARQCVSRAAAFPLRHRLDLQRRAAALRRRFRRSFRGHARLRAEGRRARWRAGPGARTGAVDLRRQDHDVSQARRACARRARAVLSADEARRGRATRRCRAATCRDAIATRGSRSCAAAIRNCRRRCCARSPIATARARCAFLAMRNRLPIWARISARSSPRAKSTICSPRNGRRTADDVLWRRTKCGLPMTQAQRDAVAEYMAPRA